MAVMRLWPAVRHLPGRYVLPLRARRAPLFGVRRESAARGAPEALEAVAQHRRERSEPLGGERGQLPDSLHLRRRRYMIAVASARLDRLARNVSGVIRSAPKKVARDRVRPPPARKLARANGARRRRQT
eukprot:9502604-Pyramimonas_sp.AAC.1